MRSVTAGRGSGGQLLVVVVIWPGLTLGRSMVSKTQSTSRRPQLVQAEAADRGLLDQVEGVAAEGRRREWAGQELEAAARRMPNSGRTR